MFSNMILSLSVGAIVGISVGGAVLLALIITLLIIVPMKLWFRALVSHAHISMGKLIGMKMRGVAVESIVPDYITARKAGVKISVDELETHYMAGGDVTRVVKALIAAHSANIDLSVAQAKAIDLAGRDVYQAVRTSVVPQIIETPMISAVAKDGIELKVKAKVTVMSNMNLQISGANEETILARVGEGIVTTVGSMASHKMILESPELISSTILEKGLDRGTAYEIVSVDIADIDVGRNIDAQLEIDRAEADKKIAQARAEEKKAMALAAEQEMRAKVQEMRALVVKAEADVPRAMAEALRRGKISAEEYYNFENVKADTSMRKSISEKNDATNPDKSLNKPPKPQG